MKRGWVIAVIIIIGVNIQLILAQEASCTNIDVGTANDAESVDITLVGDAGIPSTALKRIAEDLVAHMQTNLPSTHPYNEFRKAGKLDIRIVTQNADLSCCASGTSPCNPAKVAEIASVCPTDEIIVVSTKINELNCQRARILGTYGKHALVSPNAAPTEVLHELGKSMAFLGEERLYKGELGEYDPLIADLEANQELYKNQLNIFNFPNCEKNPECTPEGNCLCKKWQCTPQQKLDNPQCGIEGAQCVPGCGFSEYRRDSENDIMRKGNTPSPLEEIHLRHALSRYLESNSFKEPMSIEVNKPTEDLFIQNFLDTNKEGHKGIIPAVKYDKAVPENVQTPDKEWWEDSMELATAINPFCNNFLDFGGLSKFECTNIRVTDSAPAELKLTFTGIQRKPKTNAPDTVLTTFKIKTDISGKAKYRGSGSFDVNCLFPPGLEIHKNCENDLPDVPWKTSFDTTVKTEMKYSQAPNGVIKVEPKITRIIRPQDIGIKRDKTAVQIEGLPAGAPQDFINFVTDVILAEEDAPAYAFATAEPDECPPDQKCLATHLERNFDDIGLAFKYSTDTFGTGNYPNTHEPRNLFLDFYAEKVNPSQPSAVEIESGSPEGGTRLRLTGLAAMNLPLAGEKAECIKDIQHNFKNALKLDDQTLQNFIRQINLNPESYGNLKVSQNYINYHIANLWNRGHLCAEKEIPIAFFPITIDPDTDPPSLIQLKKITYKLIPQHPYYINYEDTGDTNGDSTIDFKDEVISSGDFTLAMTFIFEGLDPNEEDDVPIQVISLQNFKAPLTLEEPDITKAFSEGFTFAQSFLKSEVENIIPSENDLQCLGTEEQCSILRNQIINPSIVTFIKESYTSPQISRSLEEAPVRQLRDVFEGQGVIADYFSPGISLDFGSFVQKITQTQIEGKYAVFAYDLVPKCGSGEECGPASRAFINSVEDTYFKNGQSCKIDQACTESGCLDTAKECLENLKLASGDLHHYFKIDFNSRNPFIAYSLLDAWNPFTSTDKPHFLFLAEDQATFDALAKSKSTGSGNGNVEDITPNAEVDVRFASWVNDATIIMVPKSRTAKGAEQDVVNECAAAARLDQDCNNFQCSPEILFVKVQPTLRKDTNDNYIVCRQGIEIPIGPYLPPSEK